MSRNHHNISPHTQKVAACGILGALALVLSALELMIPPLPMLPPGAKLGLANIVTMFTAESLGLGPALAIAVVKGLFAGMTRGITAMLMSLSGGLLSTFVMWLLLKKVRGFGLIGVGIAGALCHNAAQLGVAALLTTPAVIWYTPWLILFGILTGTLTGIVLKLTAPALSRIPGLSFYR